VAETIFEYSAEQQIEIDDMQFGFVNNMGTTGAIFIVRNMQENFRVKEKSPTLALLIRKSF